MPRAARGSRSLDRVVAGDGCRVRATPNGTTRRGTPPGQGGIEILARADCGRPCDHAVRLPAVQVVRVLRRDSVPRQSAGLSSCATEGRFHSAVLEQGC